MNSSANTQPVEKTVSFGKGIVWLAFSHLIVKMFFFASGIVTARLLIPEDFGIISMAATIIGFIEYLRNMGIEAFIISKKDIEYKQINTVYLVDVLFGFLFTLITMIFAPFAADFYHSSEVKTVLNVAGFTFFVSALSSIPKVLLLKKMRQDIVSKVSALEGFFRSIFTIIFAILGFKYLSYAIPVLISYIISMFIYSNLSGWKYSFRFDFSILKEVWNYSKSYMPKSLLTYFVYQSDYIIVGYLLGKEMLGYYYFGFEKAFLLFMILVSIAVNAYMPLFSRFQSDKQELLKNFISIAEKQSFMLYPIFFIQLILAQELITLIYGTRWINSILTFQLLIGVLFTRSFQIIIVNFFDAIGKPGVNLKISCLATPLLVICFYTGAKFGGLTGVSIAAFIAHTFSVFIAFFIFSKEMKIKLNTIFKIYLKAFIPILAMIPIVLPLKCLLLYLNTPKILIIIIISIIVALLYLYFSKLFLAKIYEETFISIMQKVLKKLEVYKFNIKKVG